MSGAVDIDAGVRRGAGFEEQTYRKVTLRLIPFLVLCYVAAYLDRVNVGFAKLQMLGDLHFSETAYGLGAGVFFIGYFLFEVPSNLMLQRVGARAWIARIMVTWALVSGAFFFVQTTTEYYVLRFFLGAAEAGFYPGIVLYLMQWYPARRRSHVLAIFMVGIPLAGIVGGPLSGFLLEAFKGVHGYAGWRWLFLIEAAPSLVLGVAAFFYLANRPGDAKWLTVEEAELLTNALDGTSAHQTRVASTVGQVFCDARILLMALIYFCVIMGQYGLTFWMPTLIRGSGVRDPIMIGLLSAIPFVVGAVSMISFGKNSDRTGERRWHLIIPMAMGAIGYLITVWAGSNVPLSMLGLSLAAAGVLTPGPLFWALPTAILSGTGAATGIAAINAFAGLAGFVSPYLIGWLRDLTHSATIAMYVSAGVVTLGAAMILLVPAKLVNR
ncbi:sugar phosphate permease [Trinickia symbiotica]|uniref:MFS transporter n=1 Tax=Trinickia symbiotica TaxID=863227 RepID=A0A2N7X4Y2_9BURK|nr:MFS transporter [Trinickia symbiotica]PMS36819.1 MFS transporter [Trinickia symbiotica]PPK46272.1 sugar phosphate permease [Trinickia symbiotica]